jgi:GT2 family glycosyltransferase
MLSIIIASINDIYRKQITNNIKETIGCDYELLIIDNKTNPKGLCEVYNDAAAIAKYPYLLFLHEDILFHVNNWGLELVEILQDNKIGLVGTAGAIFKSSAHMSWVCVPSEYYRCSLFSKNDVKKPAQFTQNRYDEVVVVDGMFLALRKEVWENIPFSKDIKGFHLYDIDLSYRIFTEKYKIVVPQNIIVQHLSGGNFSMDWYLESESWHRGKKLPVYLPNTEQKEISKLEAYAYVSQLSFLMNHKMEIQKWISLYLRINLLNKRLHVGLLCKIIKCYLSMMFFLIIVA